MSRREDQVSLNIFDLIDSICREFRAEWKQRRQPPLDEWVGRVPAKAQPQLFYNLLEADIRYRARNGQSPSSDDYLSRFPQFARQIRQAFDESTMGSIDEALKNTPDDSAASAGITRTFEIPAANRLGDYELVGELGRGGMGVVYEARHLQRGNRVALKTLPTGVDGQEINAERLHKFRREFRSLSEINHPNLVGMQTLEVDGSQWFFTMDLIEGEDFLSYVRPNEQLDEDRLRLALKQLASGIIFLHEQGIVHRDLKPSNVLVDEGGRVLILDFGLVAELQTASDLTASLQSRHFVGTPRYAAPEQMLGERSEASDWYALGTMLHEALTGQPPFVGKPMEVLHKKQNDDPPSLVEEEQTEFAEDLATLADGLLKRDPKQRLITSQIIERLQLDLETRSHGLMAGSRGSIGSVDEDSIESNLSASLDDDIDLVGREEQLAQLEIARQQLMEKREPQVIWIRGKSGEGKSSLAEKFLRPIRLGTEMLVLSGRCYDRESVPFKVVDCWMDSLVSFLRGVTNCDLEQFVFQDLFWLTQIFPILKRVKSIEMLPSIESRLTQPENLRQLAFGALRQLLIRISEKTPVVIAVDDLQWGDADSLFAVRRILEPPDAPAIMFLGSYRSDEAERSPFLQEWREESVSTEERNVEVGPLTLEQTLDLFARLTPDAEKASSEAEIRKAHRETRGNAFFLSQLIQSFDRDSGTFQPIPLKELLTRRLSRLPAESRPILEMLSVFGQSIDVEEVGLLTGLNTTPYDTLTRMRNERLIRWLGSGHHQLIDTFHDQIRETILTELPTDARRDWHVKIASKLEQLSDATDVSCSNYPLYDKYGQQTPSRGIPRLFDLAFHLYEAGDPRATDYLILAGEESLRSYSNVEARRFLERAGSLMTEHSPKEARFRILAGIAEAELRLKNPLKTLELAQLAKQFASTNMDQIILLLTEAIGHGNLGEVSRAIESSDEALARLGRHRPKSPTRKFFRILRGLFKGWLAPEFHPFSNEENREISAKEYEIYSAMKLVHASKSHFISILDTFVSANVAALRSEKSELVALGHSGTFFAFGANGLSLLSRRPLARYQQRHVSFASPQLRSRAESDFSFGFYAMAELRRARNHLDSVISATEQSGDVLSGTLARHFIRHVYAWTQSSQMEFLSAKDELSFAEENGNVLGTFWGLYACADALARAGRLNDAASYIQRAWHCGNTEVGSGTAVCHCTQAFLMLQASEYQMAGESCQLSWSWIRKNCFFLDYMVRSLPLWIEAILGARWTVSHPRDNGKQLRYISRWMSLLYRNIKTLQPLTLRAKGRAAASLGKQRKSVRCFERSADLANCQGMPFYRAKALLDLAVVKEEGRDENRREAIELLKKMESVIPRAESWLLGDQYDDSVVAPEFDLEAWEREHGPVSPELESAE